MNLAPISNGKLLYLDDGEHEPRIVHLAAHNSDGTVDVRTEDNVIIESVDPEHLYLETW